MLSCVTLPRGKPAGPPRSAKPIPSSLYPSLTPVRPLAYAASHPQHPTPNLNSLRLVTTMSGKAVIKAAQASSWLQQTGPLGLSGLVTT